MVQEEIADLFYIILTYLEAKNMMHLRDAFYTRFAATVADDNSNAILELDLDNPRAEPELKLISQFTQFLNPFRFFDGKENKEDDLKKLTSILKNTSHILKRLQVAPDNEAEVYQQIRWILSLYYPSCKVRTRTTFLPQFKSYLPDILVPELKVAVEYKYLENDSEKLDEFLEALRFDSNAYIEDHQYETFIAVFFIEDTSTLLPEYIELAWKLKKFPRNWKMVITNSATVAEHELYRK